jgi:RNA polymerase sigma-70 factor (ECF subfamily)
MPIGPLYDEQNDRSLFVKIAEGDETAFSQLFRNYIPILHSFFKGMTKSEDAAEELIQETFLRIWLHRDRLPAIQQPRAWIYRVATNGCYVYLRKKRYEKKMKQDLYDPTQDMEMNTAHRVSIREIESLMAQAVNRLPPQRRRIYYMSRVQGMNIPGIAAELAISPNTVKNTLVTCLAFIRDFLRKAGYEM